MKHFMIKYCLILFILTSNVSLASIQVSSEVKSILKESCIECHNSKKKKGKLNIELLLKQPGDPEKWLAIHDEVSLDNMPPEDEAPLNSAKKKALLAGLPSFKAEESARLLTPSEINNSLVDFFKVDENTFNVETLLTPNYTNDSFHSQQENIMSPYYINDLYRTLEESVNTFVFARPLQKSEVVVGDISSRGHVSKKVSFKDGKDKVTGGDIRWRWKKSSAPLGGFNFPGVGSPDMLPAGKFKFTLDMSTPNFDTEVKKEMGYSYGFLKEGKPFQLAMYIKGGGTLGEGKIERIIDVPLNREKVDIEVELNRASKIGFALVQGPSGGKFKYKIDKVYGEKGLWKHDTKYPLPCVRIYDVIMEGPIGSSESAASISHKQLNDKGVEAKLIQVQKLNNLAPSDKYFKYFQDLKASGMSFEEAYRKTVMIFFMSPEFLNVYHKGGAAEKSRYVSYSLLKSPPTGEFLNKYDDFIKKKSSSEFVDWMIKHPKFNRFAKEFTEQWLGLERLKNNPPSKAYSQYHTQKLEKTFPEESSYFIQNLFFENRPIHELVTANYSFLNPSLHGFYQTGHEDAEEFGRKQLVSSFGEYAKHTFKDNHRGGILTQGAFLTVNSNGVEELPILRSVWLIENILGKHIPEPSSSISIEEFEAAKDMKFSERLELHRNNNQCNSCHARIDPIATVMNDFDTIGQIKPLRGSMTDKEIARIYKKTKSPDFEIRFTDKYTSKYDGKSLSSMGDLKSYLKTQEDSIAHSFVENLLKFTLGRNAYLEDKEKINKIVSENKKSGLKTVDLYKSFVETYFL